MIYLDNAATSWPKPEAVYRAVDDCARRVGASPGRAAHRLSVAAGRVVEATRLRLAHLLGVKDPSRLVFTLNATDALNMAIKGLVAPGDRVLISAMEHNSVVRPLTRLAESGLISLGVIAADGQGRVTPSAVARALLPDTRLVVLTHASNVVGTLNPVEEVAELLARRGVALLVDAAQTAGCVPLDLGAFPVDLVACSGHKGLLGPQGTGALYVRPGLELAPWREGGTGNLSHVPRHPAAMPERLEAGTPNTPGLAGLGAGLAEVLARGVDSIRRVEVELVRGLREGLGSLPGVRLLGPAAEAGAGVVSFRVDGRDPADIADELDRRFSVLVRPGLHCAPGAHRALGTYPEGTVRMSPGFFTTEHEIETACRAVAALIASGGRGGTVHSYLS